MRPVAHLGAKLVTPLLLLVCAASPAAAQTPPDFPNQWAPSPVNCSPTVNCQTGHTDSFFFDPITTPNTLVLKVVVTATSQTLVPDETLIVANNTQYSSVDPPYYTMYTLTAPHPVLGGQAGDTVWVLPGDYTEYSPGIDRDPAATAANGWSNMSILLDALDQPAGSTSGMWSPSGTVRFTSNNPFPQTWNTGAPAHSHMNWGFNQIGKYVLTVRGQITHTVGGTDTVLTSPTYHYTVCVIDETGASTVTIFNECGINQGVPTGSPPVRVQQ